MQSELIQSWVGGDENSAKALYSGIEAHMSEPRRAGNVCEVSEGLRAHPAPGAAASSLARSHSGLHIHVA